MPHVTIIGLGLIGGSLGMALRAAKTGYEVVGHDRDHEAAAKARKQGAVDKTEWNLPASLRGAGLVIIAVPVDAERTVFEQIAPHLDEGTVVTDTSSVKREVLGWADQLLPPQVSFVGGHPMTARVGGGIDLAAADLFAGRAYCLTPGPGASEKAIALVSELATVVGAKPFFLDPLEHDGLAAAVSQLPFLAASALVNAVSRDQAWRDAARLAAAGFDDVSRPAAGNPAAYRAICRANREAILRWLDAYTAQLATLRELVAGPVEDDAKLEAVFRTAQEARHEWEAGPRAEEESDIPTPGDQIRHFFMGSFGDRKRR